jgi:hypothetical protein
MVVITGGIAKTVKCALWGQQQAGRGLLMGHTGVPALPFPAEAHVVSGLWGQLCDLGQDTTFLSLSFSGNNSTYLLGFLGTAKGTLLNFHKCYHGSLPILSDP